MQINRKIMEAGLERLLESMFRLTEIDRVKIRNAVIRRNESASAIS